MTREIGGPSSGGGDNYDGGGGSSRNVARRFGPPPSFLTKTFHLVNDPNTNSIISWSKVGDSFIIWDYIKFSAEILPNYFRHNNFSSFVYQLNNYGFRKIGVDHQWEYASPDFQEGKPHLLSNMKRRSVQKASPRRQKSSPETLRKSMEESKHEVKKLKKQQSEMEFQMMKFKETANKLEAASKKLVVQWAKACEIIVERGREKEVVAAQENEVVKEDAVSLAGKEQPSPAAEMMMMMIGDYSVELDNLKKRVFEDDEDANMQNAIAHDFEEWLIQSGIAHDQN